MIQHINRRLAAVGAATTLVLITSACAQNTDTPLSRDDIIVDASEIAGELSFSTWWSYADEALIEKFNEEYPNVEVELQFTAIDSYPTKLQSQAASGSLPDLFAVQGAPLISLSKAGRVIDLTEALNSSPQDGDQATWKETFIPSLLEGANAGLDRPNGEIWGVPFNAISVAAIYNQDVYDAVGIEAPVSFDEMVYNCEALSEAGYIPMSLTGAAWGDWWARFAWDQTLRDQSRDDFSVSSPEYVEGLRLVQELAEAGCWDDSQITADIDAETSLFLQERTATFVSVPENFLGAVDDGAQFELGTFVIPPFEGKEPNRTLGGGNANIIAISADSNNKPAAVAFAKFLTSEATARELAATQYTIPAIDIDLSSDNILMASYLQAAANGFIDPSQYMPAPSTAGTTTFAAEVLPNLVLGKITPEEAAAATDGFYDQ